MSEPFVWSPGWLLPHFDSVSLTIYRRPATNPSMNLRAYQTAEWIFNSQRHRSPLIRKYRFCIISMKWLAIGSDIWPEDYEGFILLSRARHESSNPMRTFEGGYGKSVICEHHPETLDHIIMWWTICGEEPDMEVEIRKRLGLRAGSTSEIVERTTRILERWVRATKDYSIRTPMSTEETTPRENTRKHAPAHGISYMCRVPTPHPFSRRRMS